MKQEPRQAIPSRQVPAALPRPDQPRRRALRLFAAGLAAAGLAVAGPVACGKRGDPRSHPEEMAGAPRARRDDSKVYPD